MHERTISATLDLTSDMQREVCDLVRRLHTGRWPLFHRMRDIKRVGEQIIELAEWPRGGYAVVRWSLTGIELKWRSYERLSDARIAFNTLLAELQRPTSA